MTRSTPPLRIATEQSGKMRKDVFYQVSASDYLTWEYLPDAEKQSLIVLHPKPTGDDDRDWLRADAFDQKDSVREDMFCTVEAFPKHQRQPFVEQLEGDLDWMMRIHAGPLIASPVRFCTDGMNAAGLEKLAKITDTSTVE